jgi:hypothetical protein
MHHKIARPLLKANPAQLRAGAIAERKGGYLRRVRAAFKTCQTKRALRPTSSLVPWRIENHRNVDAENPGTAPTLSRSTG